MRAMEFEVALLDAPGSVYGPGSPEEMVESKYRYAGASCRYVFDFTTTDVENRLCRAVDSESDVMLRLFLLTGTVHRLVSSTLRDV
ncbi:hypothetical protein PPTG_22302 [Phytophthora nicotianae INRA-310]|uniref:Uncharacterized protein n=1 Tax=Phytophthora nicotianae (strain INRA-310) TaxID=761204 RepID=W2QJF8_PHYN3|nr:hypothetical protein PPTG_22302 [Phytophthora nicotianae INRA-310]ETN13046.1 hypothetical protein PPTG_22302 [Phytophthora nicotianae INRA-310]